MLIKNNDLIKNIIKNSIKYPNKVIISDKKNSLTYSQLMNLSLSNVENIKKINSKYIPIIIDRNIESVIAIIAVLFSKKIFCPISNSFPKDRVDFILNSLKNKSIINCSKEKLNFGNEIKINLSQKNKKFVTNVNNIDETFYLLFTSGTTGFPKGVKLSYKNILNTLLWSKKYLNWSKHKIGIATQFSFDISMFDLFTGLYFGVPMYIFQNPSNPIESIKEIKKNKITSIFSVPTFFSNFIKYGLIKKNFSTLKRIISGGDFFPNKDILSWRSKQKKVTIYNVWGPTETSIVNTMYKISQKDEKNLLSGKSIPVGKSHPLMEIKIFKKRNLVINGNIGEICMLGSCVSQGYLGDKKNSKNYFIYKNRKAFLTGDLGYFDKKKRLHIIGRKDNTIKISGYRVDTLEVENFVNINFKINNSYLFKLQQLDSNILCLAIESHKKISEERILKFLKKKLPIYSLPKKIVFMKKFPVNQNNKIDRNKIKLSLSEK